MSNVRPRPSYDPDRPSAVPRYAPAGSDTTNLADLLERVLDKGIVVAGDITLYLGQIELLTLKIRLLVASVDKAQEIGINWWESDPSLSVKAQEAKDERDQLQERLQRLEEMVGAPAAEERPKSRDGGQKSELEDRLARLEDQIQATQADNKRTEAKRTGTRKKE